jgi:hypothetical protein
MPQIEQHKDQDKVNINMLRKAKKFPKGIPLAKRDVMDADGKKVDFRFVYDFARRERKGWRVDKKGNLYFERAND